MIPNKDFVHLHLHDQYSILDGYGTAKQYTELAKELGFEAVSLTNHGNCDGVIRWQQACAAAGLKSILGVEAYIVPDLRVKKEDEFRYHVTLLAKNIDGFHALLRMLSVANLEGFYKRPRIDPALLLEHCQHLVVGGACLQSYINMPDGISLLKQLKRKTEVFLEIMPHAMPDQVAFNAHVLKVAAAHKVPVVATNDCHYPAREHAKLQEVLLAMQAKKTWTDPKRWKFDVDTLWLTSVAEMVELFRQQGDHIPDPKLKTALAATKDIAALCQLQIKKQEVFLPRAPIRGKEDLDEESQLISLTMEGWELRRSRCAWIKPEQYEAYEQRMRDELEIIISQGFTRYFLIVWELIDWCRRNDIMVGPGRGSSGGSIVAWFLGITQVDPIKYDLVFSRFISEARIDLPDIDMDFEDTKRDAIKRHLQDLYGEYNVISVSTFAKMKGKSVLRNVSRVFNVPNADVAKACDCIVVRSGGDARCLVAGTLVRTFNGPCAIEYLKVGDCVAAMDVGGVKWRLVAEVLDSGVLPAFELEAERGNCVKCSADHRIQTKDGWKRLRDIKIDDEVLTHHGYESINRIQAIGLHQCYDISLAGLDKGFLAGGIQVHNSDFCVKDAFDTFEDGKAFQQKYPEVSEIAIGLEGTIYQNGKHAAAMVVSANDLRDGTNAAYAMRTQSIVANWDKEDAEYMGLMKLDVLGLNSLTQLNETRKLIQARHNIDLDFETLPLDDPEVYRQFDMGNCLGVFQFNSPGMMRLCREIGVEDFDALTALNTLHRPGALRSGIVTHFEYRKHGKEPVTYIHPYIESITKESFGLIIYQEQVMRFMYDLGGLGWRTADTIRKVVSKSKGVEQFLSFKQQFIDGCLKKGTLDAETADKVFEELKHFGSYSFNKSHSCEYSLIAYWMMHCKIKFPAEFMATVLTYGSDQKKAENINECRRLGLKILLPDINTSLAKQWAISAEGDLLIPLAEIKGVGEMAAAAIVAERERNGPYKDLADLERRHEKRRVNSRVRSLLEQTMCFSDAECRGALDDARLDELSQLFDFSLSNDPMYRYRKMLQRIQEQIEIRMLRKMDREDPTAYFYFGVMDKLKFGYKERGDQKKLSDIRGTVGDLGGVYGNFKDPSDFIMIVFGSKFYQSRKNDIEHSEGKWMLVRAKNETGHSNIWTDQLWFADDLMEGKAEGLGLSLARTARYPKGFLAELKRCEACDLRMECSQVVPPSKGEFNVMIIGEAPGRQENQAGMGFVGDSGEALWYRLEKAGLDRSMFHTSNVCKCWPSQSKSPKLTHIKKCTSLWLDQEIATVKPFLILSFGNTGLRYFKGQESGIMAASGTCEWNERAGAWVVYSVHPAAALYAPENKEYVDRGVDAFVEKLGVLGFGV